MRDRSKNFFIQSPPDYTSCGPTSLHSVYEYLGKNSTLEEVKSRIHQFDEGGGTLGVVLGIDALKENLEVTLYSYNINIFDPSWFGLKEEVIVKNLKMRLYDRINTDKERLALSYYIQFLEAGGQLCFEDLSKDLLKRLLEQGGPILSGLSATWLYRSAREDSVTNEYDDIKGDPAGHFVVIYDYNSQSDHVEVADPYLPNPFSGTNYYSVTVNRLFTSILLGISSFDGNLLVIREKKEQ
ncbi:MAG: C39 family peptidase [Bdellovibrionales bacterium]|nr:C39 family peptidase [Bdellovibrionales bacterium]